MSPPTVDNSSLQLKIAQLEEQLDRMRQQYREEQEKVIKSEEQEKMTLLDHISQVVQEKEALTDKVRLINQLYYYLITLSIATDYPKRA